MMQLLTPAVFLDRDGVINVNRDDYVKSWAELQFLPGVTDALQRLAAHVPKIVVVTNQSAVGRGLLSVAQLEQIHSRLVHAVEAHGGRIDKIYYCPHHPDAKCICRKPRPGLLQRAAAEFDIDLENTFLVGDAITDIQAGLAVGCRPLLVLTGRGQKASQYLTTQQAKRCRIIQDLPAAVEWILQHYKDTHRLLDNRPA